MISPLPIFDNLTQISYLTIIIYLSLALMQCLHLYGKLTFSKFFLLSLGILVSTLHSFILYRWIDTPIGQNLSLTNMFSLMCFGMVLLTLLTALRKPVENLFIFILPLSALSIILVLTWPGFNITQTSLNPNSLIHILISIVAFSILGMAALQATLLHIQNGLLRNKRRTAMINILPPLQTMENLLFKIIWLGFILLSASLGTAFLFLDDLFIISRLQKIVFSFLAWGLFATLIYGHHRAGWRGPTAVRWTLLGIMMLIFAYFGSKLVLKLWN